jgi:AcrR family transcriptional regulator
VSANVKGDARRDRWSDHRARRRREFVDAALRVLEAQGPELLMDAVAAEAGVSKPVLYRYFHDKAALVDALAERGSQILLDRLLPAIRAGVPARSRVRDGVGAYFAVIDEHPNLYWLLARQSKGDAGGEQDSMARNREFIATTLTAVIGDYLRVYGLDSGGAEPWAYGLTGLVQSTGEWWLQRRSMSRSHVVEYVTRMIWAAIAGMLHAAGIEVDPDQPFPEARPALHALAGGDDRVAPGRSPPG